jgi:hypothetical protein
LVDFNKIAFLVQYSGRLELFAELVSVPADSETLKILVDNLPAMPDAGISCNFSQ